MAENKVRRLFRRQQNKVKDHDSVIDTEINRMNRASKNPSNARVFMNERQLQKYKEFLYHIDMQQNVSLFHYIVPTLEKDSWQCARMLYYHGALVWFKLMDGTPAYADPAFLTWKYNGMPLEVKPIPVFLNPLIDQSIPYLIGVNATIQYDSVPEWQGGKPLGRGQLVSIVVDQMAECFARLNINMMLAGDKLFIQTENTESADAILDFLEDSFGSKSPFVVTSKPLMAEPITQAFETKFDDLTSLLKEIDTWRQLLSGFGSGNYGVHKKERMITDEMSQNESSPDLIHELRERLLLEWIKDMQKVLGITVKYNKRKEEDDRRREEGMDGANDSTDESTND